MKTDRRFPLIVLMACAPALAACLAPASGAEDLFAPRNRIILNARFAFNIGLELKNDAMGVIVGGGYDDGFVRPDVSGSAGGLTWHWGYQRADQIVGNELELHRAYSSPLDGSSQNLNGDPQGGFELLYGRRLFAVSLSPKRELVVGLEGGFGSLDVNFKHDMTASGSVDRLSQRYSLGGIIPPLAPYAGTFNGPGPLISANPASTTVSRVPASAAFSAKVDGLLYGFKLGPFVEAPLAKRVSLDLSGGLAAMCAEADFTFTETIGVSAPGGSPAPRTGEAKNSEWLLGFYGNCRLSVALSDSTSVFVGGQYVHLGDVSAGTGGKLATLKAGSTYEVLAGVKFTF